MAQLQLRRDINGNKTIFIKPDNERGFSIQTNGNLPRIHSMITLSYFAARNELYAFVLKASWLTKRQSRILKSLL